MYEQNSMTKGILGAVIGSIPGILLWILLGYHGFTSTLIGFIIAFGVIFCYREFGGISDMTEIITCGIVLFISVYVGEHFSWSVLVCHNYANHSTLGECILSLYSQLDSSALHYIKGDFISSVTWSYVFAFVTFWFFMITDINLKKCIRRFLILVITVSALVLCYNISDLVQMRKGEILDCTVTCIGLPTGEVEGDFVDSDGEIHIETLLYRDSSWQPFTIGYTNRKDVRKCIGTNIKIGYDKQNGKIINYSSTMKCSFILILLILISFLLIRIIKFA